MTSPGNMAGYPQDVSSLSYNQEYVQSDTISQMYASGNYDLSTQAFTTDYSTSYPGPHHSASHPGQHHSTSHPDQHYITPYTDSYYYPPHSDPSYSASYPEGQIDKGFPPAGYIQPKQAAGYANPGPPQQQYNQARKHERFHFSDWRWEFASITFSLACFAAVVIVLITFQNKPLSSWHFISSISLNTVIAILSTLSRTALLVPVTSCISQLKWIHLVSSPRPLREFQVFDDASRGPWGALELIWRLHVKTKLASWGSLIIILTLAMGPFTQQLLSYPLKLHSSPEAIFYGSQTYDSGTIRAVTFSWVLSMFPL